MVFEGCSCSCVGAESEDGDGVEDFEPVIVLFMAFAWNLT